MANFARERADKKVKNRKQAIAIALSEAGESNQQTPKENEEHLRHTKAKGASWRNREGRGRRQRAAPPTILPLAVQRRGLAKQRIGVPLLVWNDRARPLTRRRRGNFLRLWRRDHVGSRWNHNVGARLGQVGTLLGLRLFQWRGRTDHVRLGNVDRLLGLRSVRHDATRTRGAAVRSGARRSRILVLRVMPGAVCASPNSVFGPRWRSESGPCGLE